MAVEERRQYNLAVLIILAVVCWPIAIIYYFTCPTVRYNPQQAAPAQMVTRVCPQCGRVISEDAKFCPYCGKAFQ